MAAPTRNGDDNGFTLAVVLFVMAMLTSVSAVALSMSLTETWMSRNYRSATQALYAAEAGVLHALAVINQVGVINLQNDVIDTWPGGQAPFGTVPMPQQPNYAYAVTIASDPYQAGLPNSANRGMLTSRSSGNDNAARQVEVRIVKSDIPNAPPGAIYFATDAASNPTFDGDLSIDGNDTNFSDGLTGPKLAVPGIITRTGANAQETRDSLDDAQKDQVRGAGYIPGSPATPSVMAGDGPSPAQIDQIIIDLLLLPHDTRIAMHFDGSDPPLGSVATPAITYLPGTGVTFGNGTMTGAGVLIVDNSLTINGTFDFKGLIIVRGPTQVTDVTGSAAVWGSLWTTDLSVTVGSHADVRYSTEALVLANQSGGGTGALPAPVKITAWRDVF